MSIPTPLADIPADILIAITGMFSLWRLPPALGLATVYIESNFKPDAFKGDGGDGARGGAYGLGQMTFQTALKLDPLVSRADLFHPETNALLMAALYVSNLMTLRLASAAINWNDGLMILDLASLYNSGKLLHAAPSSTHIYATNVLSAYRFYQAELSKQIQPVPH